MGLTFNTIDGGCSVTIETDNLLLRSVVDADAPLYERLFACKESVKSYHTGQTKEPGEMTRRIKDSWARRWEQNDPFSALAVFKREDQKLTFVGHVIVAHGDEPGQAEFIGIGHVEYHRQGYGLEAATAVITQLVPEIVKRGYELDGEKLKQVTATARVDNEGSTKILEALGFVKTGEPMKKHGAMRQLFSLHVGSTTKTS